MQTQFEINARGTALAKDKNGKPYLKLSVLEQGLHDPHTVNVFNAPWVNAMQDADAAGIDPDFSKLIGENVFDKETVSLGGEYWHFREEGGNRVYDTLADGVTRKVYRNMKVLVLYHTKKDIVYDENDVPRFVPGVFDPVTHEPVYIKATIRETIVNEDGSTEKRDKRFYAEGWRPEERRDAALAMYYERAGASAQVTAQAQIPAQSGDPNVQGQQGGAILNPL